MPSLERSPIIARVRLWIKFGLKVVYALIFNLIWGGFVSERSWRCWWLFKMIGVVVFRVCTALWVASIAKVILWIRVRISKGVVGRWRLYITIWISDVGFCDYHVRLWVSCYIRAVSPIFASTSCATNIFLLNFGWFYTSRLIDDICTFGYMSLGYIWSIFSAAMSTFDIVIVIGWRGRR